MADAKENPLNLVPLDNAWVCYRCRVIVPKDAAKSPAPFIMECPACLSVMHHLSTDPVPVALALLCGKISELTNELKIKNEIETTRMNYNQMRDTVLALVSSMLKVGSGKAKEMGVNELEKFALSILGKTIRIRRSHDTQADGSGIQEDAGGSEGGVPAGDGQ